MRVQLRDSMTHHPFYVSDAHGLRRDSISKALRCDARDSVLYHDDAIIPFAGVEDRWAVREPSPASTTVSAPPGPA